jgi:hypothetical protein
MATIRTAEGSKLRRAASVLANEAVMLPLAKSACGDVPSMYVVAKMRTPYMRLGVGTVVGCEEGEPLG